MEEEEQAKIEGKVLETLGSQLEEKSDPTRKEPVLLLAESEI